MPFWHLCQLKCFFPYPIPSLLSFFPSSTPLIAPFLWKSVCLFYLPPFFFSSLPFGFLQIWHPCLPQDVCHKLQSNVVTMLFVSARAFFMTLLFLFSFFLFFPSRSGAPDGKEPRYGASPISFFFSFLNSPFFVPNPCFHNSFNLLFPPSISLSRWFLCPFILCYLCVLHVRLLTPVLSTGPAPGAAPLMATPAAGNALMLSLTCLFWSWCCAVTNRTQNAQSQSSAVILAVWLYLKKEKRKKRRVVLIESCWLTVYFFKCPNWFCFIFFLYYRCVLEMQKMYPFEMFLASSFSWSDSLWLLITVIILSIIHFTFFYLHVRWIAV